MKKIIFVLMALVLMLSLCACGLFGKDSDEGSGDNTDNTQTLPKKETLEYAKTPDGRYYTVTGIGTYTSSDLVIPNSYNGVEVREISIGAFSGNTKIKTLVVEDGVKKIGASAFSGCTSIESVKISKSLEKVGSSSFEDCAAIKTLFFGSGVKEIGKNAFLGCSAVENFYYEGTIVDFSKITGTTWYELKYKTRYFFSQDYPSEAGLFWYWDENGSPAVWYDYIGSEGLKFELSEDGTYYAVTDNSSTTEEKVVIPKAHKGLPVGEIDAMAFVSDSLCEIVIPETVTKISGAAFRWCKNLKSITLPDSIVTLGESAFAGCDALESITFSKNLTDIGKSAFTGCNALTSVVLPDSLKNIGAEAFYACTSLETVSFGEGVLDIGERAFYLCISLKEVEIPKLVKVLRDSVFADCSGLKSVILHSNMTGIGRKALPVSAKVYYESDFESFEQITVDADNLWISSLYFYSESEPTEEGRFWHFDLDGKVTEW